MRPGLIGSVLVHGVVAALALVTLTGAPPDLPPASAVVPIEIIDKISDTTNVIAEAPPTPAKPEEADVAPEGAAQTVTPPVPETTETIPDPTKPKPREQPKQQQVKARDFADLFDAAKKTEGNPNVRASKAPQGENPRDAVGNGTEMSATESDAIKASIERRRVKFVDLPNYERYVVTIRIQINADGSLASDPQVVSTSLPMDDPYMKVAVDRSLRAILTAEPLPVDSHRTRRASFTIRFYDRN